MTRRRATLLVCHAPTRAGKPCGEVIGRAIAPHVWIEAAPRLRDDGDLWAQCPRPACRQWNHFRLMALEAEEAA